MLASFTQKLKPKLASISANASDEFLRAVVDACASNVAVLDEAGVILYSSRAWQDFELESALNIGKHETALHSFETCERLGLAEGESKKRTTLSDDLRRILFGTEKEFHHGYVHPGSHQPEFLMHAARLNIPGPTFRVLMTHESLPAPQTTVSANKERLRQLFDNHNIMAWEAEGTRFTSVSDQAFRMLGYSVDEWCQKNFLSTHLHPDDRERVLASFRNKDRVNEYLDLTFRMVALDGRVVWFQSLVSFEFQEKQPLKSRGFITDISERKQAEEALRDLSGRLITAQEEERRRIARELHDDVNQRMAVLSIEIDQLGRELPGSRKALEQYRKLQLHAQEISTDIHRLSYQLHPSKLDHLGLSPAVKSLCRELSENGSLDVAFQERGVPTDLPQDITLCLFRVAQESLRNSARHSGSQTAQVLLSRVNNEIRLTVSDQGRGFDTNSELMKKGLGFISMQERLKIVGGEIKIFSTAFRGTRIEVSVPLKKQVSSRQDPNHLASYLEPERTSGLRPTSSNSPLIELEEI